MIVVLKKSILLLFKINSSRIAIRLFSFNKILLFIKKLAFDGFYPLLVVLKNRFLLLLKKKNRFLLFLKTKLSKSKNGVDMKAYRSLLEIVEAPRGAN